MGVMVYAASEVDGLERAMDARIRKLEYRVGALETPPVFPEGTKLTVVEKAELAAMRAVVEAAVAYADRHMTGMGAISSTGVVTDETWALWKAVGDYREQAGA